MKTASRLAFALFFSCIIHSSFSQPAVFSPRGPGGGGSLFYPTINPGNDNEFYVTCDMSQLFHSSNFGNSYDQVPFTRLQTGNISTYEFTNNNNIAYCIANNGDVNYPVRTINGASWATVPGNPQSGDDVFSFKADYAVPGRVILGYYDALYISNDTAKTFSLIWTAETGSGVAVAGVFFDGNNIYIGTNDGLLYSSNGGTSFSKLPASGIPATQGIFSFAGAKQGGTTRFFCVTADKADLYNGIFPWEYNNFPKGVYSMDAGSNVWTSRSAGINFSNDFMMYVSMARNDINIAYLGGSDNTTGGNSVMKTSNAGASWSKVFLTTNNQNIRTGWSGHGGDRSWGFGESCFGITVAPNNAQKVLFGDYGFVHRTSDGGGTWQQAYVDPADEHPAGAATPQKRYYHSIGLENTTCWQVHWQDANNMFACYSDINGARTVNGGFSWGFNYTGHSVNTMYRIARQTGGNTMYAATSGVHDMYQSTRLQDNLLDANDPGGRIIYSTNNGAAWQLLHQFNHPVFWVATDPNNPARMYASVIDYSAGAGQGGVWVTNDLGNLSTSGWTKLPTPPRTQGHPASLVVLNDGKLLCTFSARRNSAGTFTASSGVFVYDPVANNWTDVSHPDMQYWCKDVVVDPADPTQNTWYVCVFSGWGGPPNGKGGLYRTTNRGGSWTKLTGTQFDRVTSISFNPLTSQQAYLTTETQGLHISHNMNAATPTWSAVTAYPFRQPERVFFNPFNPNEVWVTSFGNGMKVGTQAVALPVKLISFSGMLDRETVHLSWKSANEEKGDAYELQYSYDGMNFTSLQNIQGNGGAANSYSTTHNPTHFPIHYRLKIIPAAGNSSYSGQVVIGNNNFVPNKIQLMKNPVVEDIQLQATLKDDEKLQVTLLDRSGNLVLQQSVNVAHGTSRFSIPVPQTLSGGVYLLRIQSRQVNRTLRLMVPAR